MSEAKFTKGPWEVKNRNWVMAGRLHVATVPMAFDGDFSKANAYLIAVAPEMYEMLEMLTEMPTCDAKHFLETDDSIVKLLAKARGESQ